ncbi:mycofactocin-coupled SDR family oxidoreductase [Patulibacter sp. S7RM1-6]
MGRFDDQVAFVTGGARGQGRSHALGFAEEGADVVVVDACEQIPGVHYDLATREDLDETVALVERTGRRCLAHVADVRDAARLREVLDASVAELGRLDHAVLNAGIAIPHAPDADDGPETWRTMIDVLLTGVYHGAWASIPHLRERGGSITITGSTASLITLWNNPSYTAAKHGVVGLAKSMAADLSEDWVRVNVVAPTAVSTDLFLNPYNVGRFAPGQEGAGYEVMEDPARALNLLPVGWIDADVVTRTVLFLASEEGKYITGVVLPVDAGSTIAPPGIGPFVGKLLYEARNESR